MTTLYICRQSWNTAAEVMFDGSVQLHYSDLDPAVKSWEVSVTWMAYMAEATFGGGQPDICHRRVQCTAEGHVVHGLVEKPFPMRVRWMYFSCERRSSCSNPVDEALNLYLRELTFPCDWIDRYLDHLLSQLRRPRTES